MTQIIRIPTKFSRSYLLDRLEFGALILMLLYFIGARFPQPLPTLFNMGSYAVLGLLIISNFDRCIRVASKGFFIWILVGLAAASVLWSVNPSSTLSTARGLLRNSLMGVYLAARYPFKQQMKLWCYVFGLATISSFLTGVLTSQPGAWVGVFPQKNYLARIMALSSELFFVSYFIEAKKRRLAFSCFMLSFAVLLLSQGKTALVIFCLMTVVLPLAVILKQHYKLQMFLYLMFLLFFSFSLILIVGNIETILVDILGKNLELNGRIPVWQLCIDKIQERPLLGYGYAAFWRSAESLYVTDNTWASVGYLDGTTFNPHHGFIGVALSLGYLGVSLLVASLASTFSTVLRILKFTKRLESVWMLQFLMFLIVFNLFDNAGFIAGKDALWTLYVSISLSASIIYSGIKNNVVLEKKSFIS